MQNKPIKQSNKVTHDKTLVIALFRVIFRALKYNANEPFDSQLLVTHGIRLILIYFLVFSSCYGTSE